MIPTILAKVLALASVPQPGDTRHILVARGNPDKQQKVLIYILSISS